jgi:tryptophan 2,3-dioxygenase
MSPGRFPSSADDGVLIPLVDMVSGSTTSVGNGCPAMIAPDDSADDILYCWDYLHLDDLLHAQTPKSAEVGELIHDEVFFITVHQTYELWFKQILVELDSVMVIMGQGNVRARDLRTVLARLQRINEIQRLMVAQMGVLETLTPLDFLDFRAMLLPASGFQSVQFHLIENKFGLLDRDRLKVEGHDYVATLRPDHAELVTSSEHAPSLFDHVEAWLSLLSFVRVEGFDFMASYQNAAAGMHAASRAKITGLSNVDAVSMDKQLAAFEKSIEKFDVIFDREKWETEVRQGTRRFSHDAFVTALFINLYRDEPALQMPFQILTTLIDVDETLTLWRERHALMAHRMLGRLTGTAGSGYAYLDETAKRYTPFKDLFDVSTYLLPHSAHPRLPRSVLRRLDFQAGYRYVIVRQPPQMARRVTSVEGLDQVGLYPGVDAVSLTRPPGDDVDWRLGSHEYVFSVLGTAPAHEGVRALGEFIENHVAVTYV